MEFWRLYRLIYAKRWLITAIVLIAATVIFIGATLQAQKKMFRADAMIRAQERTGGDAVGVSTAGGAAAEGQLAERISGLIMLLRTSNDVHQIAATLLKLPEKDRTVRIQDILEDNGYFAQGDAVIRNRMERAVEEGRMTEAEARQQTKRQTQELHRQTAERLARARDGRGAFAEEGIRAPYSEVARDIRERVTFDPVAGPLSTKKDRALVNLVQVSVVHSREATAKLYANMICVAFMQFYTDQSRTNSGAQRLRLEGQRNRTQNQLNAARNELVAYRNRPDVAPLNPEADQGYQDVIRLEGERNNLEGQIQAARATVAVYQNLFAQESAVRTDVLPSYEAPAVKAFEQQVSAAQVRFNEVSSTYGEAHPEYQRALASLRAAKEQLNRLKSIPLTISAPNAQRESLRAQIGASQVALRNLEARLASVRQQLAVAQDRRRRLPLAQAQFQDLQRSVAIYQSNLDAIHKRINEFNMNANVNDQAGTITIASLADAKLVGADPATRWSLMAYGAILALIFGIALVVAMDALDNSIRSTTDVEKLIGLPISGVIPAQLPDPARAPRITYLDPLSPVSEAYRLLRTDLLFTAEERPFKSLMMATGKPGQGATTTSCNLAIAMAQAGKRVILVDADLRRPKLHDIFKVKNDIGLTSLLNDECEIEEALKATEIDNLLLLPSGPLPLNPSELLASPKMKALHEQLKPHTDFIIFDTPSAIAFSDATVLSSFLDAVLLVIRANNVPRGSELHVKTMLNKARANIIGVVLNGMNPEHVDSVHYHYHYYPVLTSKGPVGALNGSNGNGNGNGHRPAMDMPLALPGDGAGGEPLTTREAAAAAGGGGGTATLVAPHGAAVGETTQAFSAPPQREAVHQQPFLEQRNRSVWKIVKSALPFILLALAIGLMVLAMNNSVAGTK